MDDKSSKYILLNYTIHSGNQSFNLCIPDYYEIKSIVGKGSYGIVLGAINKRTGKAVAIKKIVNLFNQNTFYVKRILREVKIMKHFSEVKEGTHENILPLLDLIKPPSYDAFRDVCLVSPLMQYDLTRVTNASKQATERMVKYIIYQILDGLSFLHSMGIVHRDLKPSNILINKELDVKICDFGLSRGIEEGMEMTTYVSTRWYRAPELCLAYKTATFSCDVWSVGCILAELLACPIQGKSKVLFPGDHSLDQLKKIFKVLGKPHPKEIKGCGEGRNWVLFKIPNEIQTTSLKRLFSHISPVGVDLLEKLLSFDPEKRPTAKQAMEHPFFSDIHQAIRSEDERVLDDAMDTREDDSPEKFNFRYNETENSDMKRDLFLEIQEWNEKRGNKGKVFFNSNFKHIYL